MIRKAIGALVAFLLLFSLVTAVAPQASAAPKDGPITAQVNAGVWCDFGFGTNARARADFVNVGQRGLGNSADADDIWVRSLQASTNNQSTFRMEIAMVQIYNAQQGWVNWTSRGGSESDGVTIPSSLHWNPTAKTIPVPGVFWTAVRVFFRTLGGFVCFTPPLYFN